MLFNKLFNSQEWLVSNFSSQYHPWITHEGHKNWGNDHQLKKLFIKQFSLAAPKESCTEQYREHAYWW